MRRIARRSMRGSGRRAMRRFRRRMLVGGFVLLATGGVAAAHKLTQKDVERIEAHTGVPVEDLPEDQLVTTMQELGIRSIELDEADRAAITRSTS